MAAALYRSLLWAMLKEEWRLHKSFVGAVGSGFFPLVIFLFSLVLSIASPLLTKRVSVETVLLALHLGALLYGLGVGALARIGEEVMTRRLGQVSFLLRLPVLEPVSFRAMMSVFFVKDAIYYVLYSIVPLTAGLAALVPLGRASAAGVALLGLTVLLSFMLGMGVSFLLSALSTRSGVALGAAALVLLVLTVAAWPLGLVPPEYLLLPLGFWEWGSAVYLAASALAASAISLGAIVLTKERFSVLERRFTPSLLALEERISPFGPQPILLAKEWLELRRSGALLPVVTGFLGPLLAVYALIWLIKTGVELPLDFNIVFYGGILGFLGLMTYSWMTNLEPNEFLNAQPVGVDDVIWAKLRLYFLLTSPLSLAYLAVIGIYNGEAYLFPLAALVSLSTMTYVAAVASWQTGLRTNTMLFDARVLARFTLAVIPPLIIVTLASFSLRMTPLEAGGVLALVSICLFAASRVLFKKIPGRWRNQGFGI
ncbi:MAG: hypothetical protein QW379_02400 [Thermoplasmata archaeon]